MARLRERRLRIDWTRDQILQLVDGVDWPDCAWGNVIDWPLGERHCWPGDDVLAEMRACWDQCRDDVIELAGGAVTFAELVFDHGMSPQDAMAERGRTCRV